MPSTNNPPAKLVDLTHGFKRAGLLTYRGLNLSPLIHLRAETDTRQAAALLLVL